jgi:LmbE family N-acetylglucosaminyl deacetylase
MLPLNLSATGPLKVLCLGAHCDDIEIGCGGTLMVLQEQFPAASFHWVIFTTEDQRGDESRKAAIEIHRGAAVDVNVLAFRGSYLPFQGAEVKDAFEMIKGRIQPHLIFTHWLEDRHQDHRLVAELTWNTFRDHLVLEYEIVKYEGDLGHPNLFVPLSEALAKRKLDVLMTCFPSQRSRAWFTRDLFQAQLRMRGVECNAPSGHAEAFHARKVTFQA